LSLLLLSRRVEANLSRISRKALQGKASFGFHHDSAFYEDVGRVGLIMEGTGIDHSHIKLVPMHGTDHMKQGGWKQYLSDVEHWFDNYEGWISSAGGPMADRDKLVELSKKIKKSQNSDSDV
jgi:hypothetical protein